MSVVEDIVTVFQKSLRVGALWLSVVAIPLVLIAQESASGTQGTPPNVPPCRDAQPVEHPEHMVSPKYPKAALASGVEGNVEMSAVVSPDAKTKDLRVVSGDPVLVTSALKAVRQWRFRPALVKGEPVETTLRIKIRFSLLLQEAISDVELESPRETFPPPETLKFDPSEGEVYRLGQTGVIGPKPIYSPNPEFSEKARKAKEQGIVTVSAIVGTDGQPRHLRVVCSSVPDLNESATEAVKTWRFEPGTKNGKPAAVEIGVEVAFYLYQ